MKENVTLFGNSIDGMLRAMEGNYPAHARLGNKGVGTENTKFAGELETRYPRRRRIAPYT